VFTKEILNQYKYHSIILVSSPYNMRRASLVFDKWCKDLNIIYMPVPNPQFYDRKQRNRIEQLKAIAHEYAGIIYYWIKGYI
jgi:uncharacterized SAM-binding protein YcdF (DUF218 family)